MSSHLGSILRFGDFELDAENGTLVREGRILHLPPQPFKVLVLLASRAGRVVGREEIRQELWQGETFVDFEQGINQAVKQIRAALEDDPESPRFVATIPRRGYRFVAAVSPAPGEVGEAARTAALSLGALGSRFNRRAVRIAIAGAFALAVVILTLVLQGRTASGAAARLVVLPFDNLSGDPNQDFFADGLTEELVTALSNLDPDRLKVIARTSAFKYRGGKTSVRDVGRALTVNYVVEGSLRREGEHVRVAAQLIRVADETHLWAETFDHDAEGILQLQRKVATSVARSIGLRIAGRAAGSSKQQPANWEAYSAYLKGRHLLLDTKTSDTVRLAIEYFKQAIRLDPSFAMAYTGLADAYGNQVDFDRPAGEAQRLAKEAADRAAALDPDLPQAWVALAQVAGREWKWQEAERLYRQAIAAQPGDEEACHSYSHLLMALGRHDESLAQSKRLLELDPLSPHMNAHLGLDYFLAGRLDEAVAQLEHAVTIDPSYIRSHVFLGYVYIEQRRFSVAITTLKKAVSLRGDSTEGLIPLASAYVLSGDRNKGFEVMRQLERERETLGRYVSPMGLAAFHVALGDRDKAFALLEQAYAARSGQLASLKVSPWFRGLHDDRRFRDLVARVGL